MAAAERRFAFLAGWWSWWRNHPLVLFVLLGALLFVLDAARREAGGGAGRRISVSEREVDWLRGMWATQYNRAPTGEELRALIDDYIREEILAREAVRLGLDQDDTIVRRRLAQKMSFLIEDTTSITEPNDAELRGYFEQRRAGYQAPARFSFQHVYWSKEERGQDAEAEAQQALAGLRRLPETWRALGDPFMLLREYAERTPAEITEHFGGGFAGALATLPVGSWQGPLASAYGTHLVRVTGHQRARPLAFEEARGQVQEALVAERRAQANERAFAELRARYRIVDETRR